MSISSIVMMFAGLTSAYIVKSSQANWQEVQMPKIFWYSTGVILLSSLAVQMALRSFKDRDRKQYRLFISLTAVLGITFVILQWMGFQQLWNSGVRFRGASAGQFFYIIAGLHALHVTGGIVALLVMFIKAFFGKIKTYSSVGIEVAATYWHFVDFLWLYLMIFFLWLK